MAGGSFVKSLRIGDKFSEKQDEWRKLSEKLKGWRQFSK
jgi:hypothetical protein